MGAGPLILHDAEEIHHLVAEGGEVAGRGGINLSGDAQALLDQLLEAPASTVAGEHGEVVEMNVAALVSLGHLLVIDLAEPVVGGDGAGVGEDQAAYRVGDSGVLLHPPVVDLHIVIHQSLVVQHGGLDVADLLPLFAVENVSLGHVLIAGLTQYALYAVLNIFHGNAAVMNFVLIVRGDLQSQEINDVLIELLLGGLKGLGDRDADLGDVEIGDLAVALDHLIHNAPYFLV